LKAALRGAARLAVQATLGVTDLVEAVHARIASVPGLPATRERTLGITGLVYKSVRGVTRVVGSQLDGALNALTPALEELNHAKRNAEHEVLLAVLNGVLGDHLADTGNPLAIPMSLRQQGVPVDPKLLPAAPGSKGLLVLLHGLCMNDQQWLRNGHNHGSMLAQQLGLTPVYLHYNTGLPIHQNGAQFAALMAQVPPQRIVLLGHSMGGLVARSSLHQAQGEPWTRQVTDLICLGSPHQGAPMERAGHGIDRLLDAAPYAAPFSRLGKLRSQGITSLRHGQILADNSPAPLPDHVRCFALAGRLSGAVKAQLLGDGMVPVNSALARNRDPAKRLAFAEDRQVLIEGVGHLNLLSDERVAAQLLAWLKALA
jgi:pimeloyl-ACP methyl ester carboxylesterase